MSLVSSCDALGENDVLQGEMNAPSLKFPVHVRAFSDLLVRLRRQLGNDLDLVLILSVIAERHYALIDASRSPDAADPDSLRARLAINAHSVALYVGMPRETVRRKIEVLVEKGWVERGPTGALSPTSRAAEDLSDGTAATLDYISSIMCGD